MKGDAMITLDLRTTTTFTLMALAAAALMGCSSAEPTDDPGVDRMGQYVLINKGPEAEMVIGYRHAQNNLGSEWLLLEAAVTSPPGQTARIEREKVSVRTPVGTVVPLATQKEFNQAYSSLQAFLRKADVVREPMDYWPPRKQDCPFQFFVGPGQGVSFDEFSVNDFRACQGRLLFDIPGGVQPGRYVLSIDLEESEIEIPFTLED